MREPRVLRVVGGRAAYTNTSQVPDATVAAAIRFCARHIDCTGIVFRFRNYTARSRTYGRAYRGLPYPDAVGRLAGDPYWCYLVVVRMHSAAEAGGWRHTLAHELKHVENYRVGRGHSEGGCDAWAAWLCSQWADARAEVAAADERFQLVLAHFLAG